MQLFFFFFTVDERQQKFALKEDIYVHDLHEEIMKLYWVNILNIATSVSFTLPQPAAATLCVFESIYTH